MLHRCFIANEINSIRESDPPIVAALVTRLCVR